MLAVNWTDVLDGEIVNAAWALAGMVARPRTSRRVAASLDIAAWADTERLIRNALSEIAADPELAELSGDEAAALEAAVRRPEVQGALQALLAVRLTNAPALDGARARRAVRLALTSGLAGPRYAAPLSEYFDEKISALVALLERRVGFAGLAQVRAEAYNARVVALLGAIESQVAALADSARRTQDEAEFLDQYRRQAHQRHGFLIPPDFDRRRRVPVADIYVPARISEENHAERARQSPDQEAASRTVWDLAGLLDRTVLLGDPGGGKTTAANVLTDHFARDGSPRAAFLVTLREYASKTPIEWSVTEHIEQNLSTLYHAPAPDGLVERLLLTGRAVVIFDGLDELLDTSRRRAVSDRIEQFCSAYPLTPVLVTSRVVGYDQARLDDTQFSCYELCGFGEDEVSEYARKWFMIQEGVAPAAAEAEATAFLRESVHARDLRANPLLLSLMCILYRGEGLPGDRAGVYAGCTGLLLRKWDEQRDLYRKLDSDHLVEPVLRYLAWWLFTRETGQTAATERELTAAAAEFLYGRGYDTQDQARAAAGEFVEFCRGRMWVFSDAGTTADGERLYGFTHRTFLEYFAASHLAASADSPEDLARILAPRIASAGWGVVAELAIRQKGKAIDRGADRVYRTLLDLALAPPDRPAPSPSLPALQPRGLTGPDRQDEKSSLLGFLAACLPAIRPSPFVVRDLARATLDYAMGHGEPGHPSLEPLFSLLSNGHSYAHAIADELGSRISSLINSGDMTALTEGVRLLVSIPYGIGQDDSIWRNLIIEQGRIHQAAVNSVADLSGQIMILALAHDFITLEDALAMPGGLSKLATVEPTFAEGLARERGAYYSYMTNLAFSLRESELSTRAAERARAVGRYLLRHGAPPWVNTNYRENTLKHEFIFYDLFADGVHVPALDEAGCLGATACLCIILELYLLNRTSVMLPDFLVPAEGRRPDSLIQYLNCRISGHDSALPDLPVPTEFRQLFRDWAGGRVNFVEFTGSPRESRETRARSG